MVTRLEHHARRNGCAEKAKGRAGHAIGLGVALAGAGLVVSGEGRFDAQTDAGKAPAVVVERARAAGVPVALVAGLVVAEPRGFVAAQSLTELAGSSDSAQVEAPRWLRVNVRAWRAGTSERRQNRSLRSAVS